MIIFRSYCEKMKEGSVNRGLIVIRGSMTPFAKQVKKFAFQNTSVFVSKTNLGLNRNGT